MGRRSLLVAVVVFAMAASLWLPGAAGAATKLIATVGPGFEIALADANGNTVRQLEPGDYDIEVRDRSDAHNFHLTGPGVDRSTRVDFVGTTTWTVTLANGTYRYVCDPHATDMRGSFTVGNPPTPTTPTTPTTPSQPKAKRLVATVGPEFTISLKTPAGKAVKAVAAGLYTIAVRDRSAIHNFHLVGPGVNKKTAVGFTGTRTWRVRLAKGKTYRFVCDPHANAMRGSLRVT